MQPPERSNHTHFPNLGLLRSTAEDFGLADTDAVCLDAILYAALSFGAEAEDGAFGCIYLSYGQGEDRVNLTVTGARDDGYRLVLEQAVSGAKDSFKAGLAANTQGVGRPLTIEAVHVAGKPDAAGLLLESIGELRSLVLVAKEVSEQRVSRSDRMKWSDLQRWGAKLTVFPKSDARWRCPTPVAGPRNGPSPRCSTLR